MVCHARQAGSGGGALFQQLLLSGGHLVEQGKDLSLEAIVLRTAQRAIRCLNHRGGLRFRLILRWRWLNLRLVERLILLPEDVDFLQASLLGGIVCCQLLELCQGLLRLLHTGL
ncbi:hypothetical protein, partial [Fischerella thermalis]|uniref:hypothetical protein n=1 Tax=Fischerella thermalis TaxID=372787 RepID=UPI001F2A2CEB